MAKLNPYIGCLCLTAAATASFFPVAAEEKNISVDTGQQTVEVTPFGPGIFRVRHLPAGVAAHGPSQAVDLTPYCQGVDLISTPECSQAVSDKGMVRLDNQGRVQFTNSRSAKDLLIKLSETAAGPTQDGGFRIAFRTPEGANFYGAGERGHSLRLNGDTLTMYNRQNYGYTDSDPRISQMGISVPYLVSDSGFGIFFDDFSNARLILGDQEIVYESDSQNPIDYYILTTQDISDQGLSPLPELTSLYTELTGRQPLPPLWTLGYVTSKYGYKTQEETEQVVKRLKESGYPLDGLVLDLYWYGVEQDMGRLEWDPAKWPDHKGMLDHLKKQGVNTVLITQPYINKGGAIDNYNLLSAQGMLAKDSLGQTHDVTTWVGDAGMLDVSNPDTRRWLWERLRPLTEEGVAGWWGDLGEPEVHPATIHHANGLTAEQYHNAYGNEWSRTLYEGLRRDFPERRPMLMMRGGTAGLQRYGVFPWTTDVSRSWGGLKPQVKLMLSSGLSGLAYMGSDVGGFAVDPENPTDPELYVRWLQMGAFSPMLRTHAQEQPEPFNYPEMEPILKDYIKMRYRWLPYNYTLAFENAALGLPLARPLNMADPSLTDVEDEYLWGRDVLVAPVMEPGATSRQVVFPKGKWYDFFDPSKSYTATKAENTFLVDAPLEKLPLFVRAGAVIPLATKEMPNTSEYDPTSLTLLYFPSGETTTSTVFDDDHREASDFGSLSYNLLRLEARTSDDKLTLELQPAPDQAACQYNPPTGFGGPNGKLDLKFEAVDMPWQPEQVSVAGKKLKMAKPGATLKPGQWSYDPASKTLRARFTAPVSGAHLEASRR